MNNYFIMAYWIALMVKDNQVDRSVLSNYVDSPATEVKEMTTSDEAKFLPVLSACCGNQSKLSRLIKGVPLYFDLLGQGDMDVKDFPVVGVKYSIATTIDGFSNEVNTAYVWSGKCCEDAYNCAITMMAQTYLNRIVTRSSNVAIPSDGDVVKLVAGGSCQGMNNHSMWAAIIHYCIDTGQADLEEAITIAPSLRQNKYLEVVYLPQSVLRGDLVMLMLRRLTKGTRRFCPSATMGKFIGRVHQMAIHAYE